MFTHNNSKDNILRGLGERLFYVENKVVVDGVPTVVFVKPPTPKEFDLDEYAELVAKKMPKFTDPISRDEFVALYDGSKRKRYEAAAKSLQERELDDRDWNISLFIKDEKVMSWNKPDPAPRLISPRSPEYCLEVGRFIKPIEHLLYKAVARVWGETTIAKGLNFNQRGQLCRKKWDSFLDPVAVGLDASRFDQHVSVPALKWEHGIYQRCFPRSKRLKTLLSKQLINKGVCYVDDHKIEYIHHGGRMSGDMNTALGNCLIMTGLVWHYAKFCGVEVKLINDGDDCVVFLERSDLHKFMDGLVEWFVLRGFTMKVEDPVTEFERLEFCQCHPVWNGEQYSMCRNVHKALFTDTVHVGRTVREILSIRKATSDCGKCWSKGFPVFGSFYEWMNPGDAVKATVDRHSGTFWNAKGCHTGTSHVTPEARASFERAFGLDPSEQLAIEALYNTLDKTEFNEPQSVLRYDSSIKCTEYPLFVSDSLSYLLFKT